MDETVKKTLIDIVGEKNYTDRTIDIVSFSYDASEEFSRPGCGVWVETTEQVSKILKLANRERIPVTPRGAGTGLSGMAVPSKGGIVMDFSRMNKILKISVEDRLVVVQPGVINDDLDKALAPYGFFFPPDPASSKVCTLGGNVALNAGGIKGAKYGTTRDYVLGMKVVLPDGRIMTTGSMTMKSVSGYDLCRLFVGSEGTLGVMTELILKINPKPPESSTALATFDLLEDAGNAVSEIMFSGVLPSVLEIVDRQSIIAFNQYSELKLPDAEAILLVETDGYTKEETEFQMSRILDIFKKNHAASIREAASPEEAQALWVTRKSAYGVTALINNNLIAEDLAVPMSKVPDMLKATAQIAEKYDLKIPTVGHLGDGNVHPVISFDSTDPDEVKRVEAAVAEIFETAVELGGSLTAEHGIGLSKAPFMELEHDSVAMDVMRSLKRTFDPNNILNPGKMALDD
jgi:glycolate oxidase